MTWIIAGVAVLLLVLMSLAGPVMNWPATDEANYLLEALRIAHGQLPYRDFYEFITPGGQLLGSLFIKLGGFSVVGLRILVLFGWLLEMALIYEMGKTYLSKSWLLLLMTLLWLTFSRYPVFQHHFFSGLTALLAVFFVWRYLQGVYAAKALSRYLLAAGVCCAITFWITQSLGVLITIALGLLGLLHCLLHEREEKGITFREISNQAVAQRWFKRWGVVWLLPMLAVHAVCIGILCLLGIWDDFLRDAIFWLLGGHYQATTVIGYFPTFHSEFEETLRPLIEGVPWPILGLFLLRIPIALHLVLMGVLPVVGLLGVGYQLPNRFAYRLLRLEDEALLLFWIAAMAMIISTLSYSTSMHLVSNGALAFLLGWIVLYGFLKQFPKRLVRAQVMIGIFCILLLLGAVVGSGIQVLFGVWLPRLPGLGENLLYTDFQTDAGQFLNVVDRLAEARSQKQPVFVFSQTPSLYLASSAQNATRFTLVLPHYTTDVQMREIMADLQKNKPLYIVDDQSLRSLSRDVRFAAYRPDELRLPELEGYIQRYYVLDTAFGRYVIYRRVVSPVLR